MTHSEYSNTPWDEKTRGKENLIKQTVELIENGVNALTCEKIEEALRYFKLCSQLFKKHPQANIDDNYVSVL